MTVAVACGEVLGVTPGSHTYKNGEGPKKAYDKLLPDTTSAEHLGWVGLAAEFCLKNLA